MKIKIIILTGITLLTGCLIFSLHLSVDKKQSNRNSFIRHFFTHPILASTTLSIPKGDYYLAGVTKDSIYLGNPVYPLNLIGIDSALTGFKFIRLTVTNTLKNKLRSARLHVDSLNFYIMDGIGPYILTGRTRQWQIPAAASSTDSIYFSDCAPVSPTSFILRTLDFGKAQYVLSKKQTVNPVFKSNPDILQKQVDGLFCTDGMLLYNPTAVKAVYVYYYRNQFMCMDTSLKVLLRANTIDTISRADIRVSKIKSENTFVLSAPATVVNSQSCISQSKLLILSERMSLYENASTFKKSAVLDVYSLKSGSYDGSFYLFGPVGKKPRDLRISGRTLYTLYNGQIISHQLNPTYF